MAVARKPPPRTSLVRSRLRAYPLKIHWPYVRTFARGHLVIQHFRFPNLPRRADSAGSCRSRYRVRKSGIQNPRGSEERCGYLQSPKSLQVARPVARSISWVHVRGMSGLKSPRRVPVQSRNPGLDRLRRAISCHSPLLGPEAEPTRPVAGPKPSGGIRFPKEPARRAPHFAVTPCCRDLLCRAETWRWRTSEEV